MRNRRKGFVGSNNTRILCRLVNGLGPLLNGPVISAIGEWVRTHTEAVVQPHQNPDQSVQRSLKYGEVHTGWGTMATAG